MIGNGGGEFSFGDWGIAETSAAKQQMLFHFLLKYPVKFMKWYL